MRGGLCTPSRHTRACDPIHLQRSLIIIGVFFSIVQHLHSDPVGRRRGHASVERTVVCILSRCVAAEGAPRSVDVQGGVFPWTPGRSPPHGWHCLSLTSSRDIWLTIASALSLRGTGACSVLQIFHRSPVIGPDERHARGKRDGNATNNGGRVELQRRRDASVRAGHEHIQLLHARVEYPRQQPSTPTHHAKRVHARAISPKRKKKENGKHSCSKRAGQDVCKQQVATQQVDESTVLCQPPVGRRQVEG